MINKHDIDRIGYDAEEVYFNKMNNEAKKKFRERLDAERLANLQRHQGAEHWMRCPKCAGEMVEISVHSLRLDRCNSCHGIFFDAGELELLIRAESGEQLQHLMPFLH